jgi:phosphatidylinositol alpha-1,6-mannosyltransferase
MAEVNPESRWEVDESVDLYGGATGSTLEERPRALFLTPDFPPGKGGIQLLLHRVAALCQRIECRVLTLEAPGSQSFDRWEAGVAVRRVRLPAGNRRLGFAALNAAAVREASRWRPHAILSGHTVTAPGAVVAGRRCSVPVAQYLYADEVPAHPWLASFAVRQATANIAISAHTERLALARGADARRIHRIPPGVDLPQGRQRARDDRPTILTVARLSDRYKGHDVVLAALPRVLQHIPTARWVVVGDGALRPELEREATERGLDGCVHFTGEIDDRERDAWFDRAHVFVMPSRLPPGAGGEGFGIVYLEAGAHELPVVAGACGGATDAVDNERTGLLVDPTDPSAVADALVAILVDSNRAHALGRAGHEKARELAWPRVAALAEDVLLDLMACR